MEAFVRKKLKRSIEWKVIILHPVELVAWSVCSWNHYKKRCWLWCI